MRRLASTLPLLIVFMIAVIASPTHHAGGANIAGRSVTLLSDGRWLLLGGTGARGVQADAVIVERDGSSTTLSQGMHRDRAWHTATVLPDGTVLIIGGIDRNGDLVSDVEVFTPSSASFELVNDSGVTERAYHTASLLTDGRLLIVGGVSNQAAAESTAEIWSSHTRTVDGQPARLMTPRRGHNATLLPDGRLWISGGQDAVGAAVSSDEAFEPGSGGFAALQQTPQLPTAAEAPRMAASFPADGEHDVPTDAAIAIRFSKPMRPGVVSKDNLRLTGPLGAVSSTVAVAEGGRLAFITPTEELFGGTTYTVILSQGIDTDGIPLSTSSFTFTTALPTSDANEGTGTGPFGRYVGHHGHGQYDLTPPGRPAELDEWEWRGERRDGKPYSPWQSLPPLLAAPGVTALSGQVLRLNGQPLADVTLQIGHRTTRADRSGRFLLSDVADDDQILVIDGSTANRPGRTYGIFDYKIYLHEHRTTILPFTIWMPLLDTEHATAIPVPTSHEIVATTPRIPGLEVRIPANVVLQTAGGPLRWMSLTRIPVDRPPFPLPEGTNFFFTPQAHGAVVLRPDGTRSPRGVRMIMPNPGGLAAGYRLDLWSYDTAHDGAYVYGQGTVARDERRIVPDSGVEFFVVKCGLWTGGESTVPANNPILNGPRVTDPVDPATGLFVYEKTDLVVPDVMPIVIARKYRQLDSMVRPFGLGFSHDYQMYLAGDATAYTYADLILGDGSRIRYNRISSGTGHTDAVMEHTLTPTRFYRSRLSWDAAFPGFKLVFLDGQRIVLWPACQGRSSHKSRTVSAIGSRSHVCLASADCQARGSVASQARTVAGSTSSTLAQTTSHRSRITPAAL